MTYAAFFKELGVLSEGLDRLVEEKPEPEGMPLPYLWGNVCVHLDGSHVGHFEVSDGFSTYLEDQEKWCPGKQNES